MYDTHVYVLAACLDAVTDAVLHVLIFQELMDGAVFMCDLLPGIVSFLVTSC